MNRRDFLKAMVAAVAAPAIVRAGSLMRIDPKLWVPPAPSASTVLVSSSFSQSFKVGDLIMFDDDTRQLAIVTRVVDGTVFARDHLTGGVITFSS